MAGSGCDSSYATRRTPHSGADHDEPRTTEGSVLFIYVQLQLPSGDQSHDQVSVVHVKFICTIMAAKIPGVNMCDDLNPTKRDREVPDPGAAGNIPQ